MSKTIYRTLKRLDTLHSFRIIVDCEMVITCWEGGFLWVGKNRRWMDGGYRIESPIYNFVIGDHTPFFYLTYPLPEVKWDEKNIATIIDKYDLWNRDVFLQDWRHRQFEMYEVRVS